VGLLTFLRGEKPGLDVNELASRMGLAADELKSIKPAYAEFTIPKRSGGERRVRAPERRLKGVQRLLLHRVFGRLRAHPAAHGFERGRSIATNAALHAGKAVVVKLDVRDFFDSTRAGRVRRYMRRIGWSREASALIERLCTHKGGLPQGAPTSPRLANLVNFGLDAAMTTLARRLGADYTRYADDLTISFDRDDARAIGKAIRFARRIFKKEGYELHDRTKLRVMRRHERQLVTGLVVNERPALPRRTRRWLRAVEHRRASGRRATIGDAQLQGWRAYRSMVERAG
jgi:retron-type reverse transcriptase